MLPEGTGSDEAVVALEVVEKNPKKDWNELPIENKKAVAGEIGFAASNPFGSCGVVKKSAVNTRLFATEVLTVRKVEAILAENVSEGTTAKGIGGAAFEATI